MALPTTNNNPESSLTTLPRDDPSSSDREKSPAGLSLSLPPGNGGGGGSRRRVLTTCNSRSINERLYKDEIIMAVEEVANNSANDIGRGRMSVICSSFLARVDPILDFWTVDGEGLVGSFQVWSSSPSVNHSMVAHQQAVIFKVKTTSPYSFSVRPICGLMRPNVVATITVKCERRSSPSTMENEEFLVEVAPVAGAIGAMTNDLYTSVVSSNFPELMAVWERIDQHDSCTKEFHRISCRFHRTAQQLESSSFPRRIKEQLIEQGQVERFDEGWDNNNLRIFNDGDAQRETTSRHIYENCSFTRPTEMKCYLARESAADPQGQNFLSNASHDDEELWYYYRSKMRRLQIFSFILGILLIAALVYILFSLFYNRMNGRSGLK